MDDPAFETLLVGRKVKVLLSDIDLARWRQDLTEDRNRLATLNAAALQVDAARDDKLGKLRDIGTDPVHFRQLAGEIAAMLAYEATREMPVETRSVPTWAGPLDVAHVRAEKVTLVPILLAYYLTKPDDRG